MDEVDKHFYNRADEHINLSNDQLKTESRGKVSASMMYGLTRFNSWISACGWNSGEEMKSAKKETLDYFVNEYRKMLEENLDDYINNFDDYMKPEK
ncbi:DUF3144 domain-containing protein [Aquimarina sp. 2304DJ70-9]|uniref:DUF3144 domain-containing protein n=1 Tax=Aquimarina penaris TaxID=3231044 RepID=UPI0034637CBD